MTDAPNPSAAKTGEPVDHDWTDAEILRDTVPADLLNTEAVARIIDPEAWSRRDEAVKKHGDQWLKFTGYVTDDSEEKADAILSLYTHPQPSLSVGLDREAVARVICYWSEPSTCHDAYCPHECAAVRPDEWCWKAADAILALAAPAELK